MKKLWIGLIASLCFVSSTYAQFVRTEFVHPVCQTNFCNPQRSGAALLKVINNIQANANSRWTINVEPGTYILSKPLPLNAYVAIMGQGPSQTLIQNPQNVASELHGPAITLKNLRFNGVIDADRASDSLTLNNVAMSNTNSDAPALITLTNNGTHASLTINNSILTNSTGSILSKGAGTENYLRITNSVFVGGNHQLPLLDLQGTFQAGSSMIDNVLIANRDAQTFGADCSSNQCANLILQSNVVR